MVIGGAAIASCALASQTALSTATTDTELMRPLKLYMDGIDYTDFTLIDGFSLDDSLGEQMTCRFTLVNVINAPVIGDHIRVVYYSEVLFDGTVNTIKLQTNNLNNYTTYECEAVDWTAVLARHKVRRNFVNQVPAYLMDSLFDNELAGCGFSIGTIDQQVVLPLVDSSGGSALDVLRELASATGQIVRVNADREVSLISTSWESAPKTLDINSIETVSVSSDVDQYRNVQTVIVKGTIAEGATGDPIEVVSTGQNDDQIAERAAIDGTDGRFEAVDELTHPTSNDAMQLQILGQSYVTAKLAVSGVPKVTAAVQVRGYAFRSGQQATLTVDSLGLSGSWIIQHASFTVEAGRFLIYSLELTQSSVLQRAYDAWLRMIDRGKVIVQLPGTAAVVATTVTFTTPGASAWVVPAGVTLITLTMTGASASGTGSWDNWSYNERAGLCLNYGRNGNKGGNGGKAIASVSVTPGDTINLTVGAKGTPGGAHGSIGSLSCTAYSPAGNGSSATDTTAYRMGVLLAAAYGGVHGTSGTTANQNGASGANGGGSGGIVTVGGGRVGGAGGSISVGGAGAAGQDGMIEISYYA